MRVTSSTVETRPFNLIRWFSLTALLSVALVSMVAAWTFSAFLTDRMIRQEAEITAGFVRSIVATENAYAYFDGTRITTPQQFQNFLDHMNRMPGVLRTNVYSADRHMVWSSDSTLIGQRFERNDELEEALQADLVIHSGVIDPARLPKSEHVHLERTGNHFIESYIPIFDVHGRQVVGVIELYKVPTELFEALEEGVLLIWIACGAAGLFLFGALFWTVRRAHGIIAAQGDKLVENESLAAVGEMCSAVAHGLRHPLASIRSSAEVASSDVLPVGAQGRLRDIIAQVERLEGWGRQLLACARPAYVNLAPVDINPVMLGALAGFARDLDQRGIRVSRELADNLPPVRGDAMMLTQLMGSLITGAMDAMESGGELAICSRLDPDGRVIAEVRDSGPGIAPADMSLIFKPPLAGKAAGSGLGLPMLRGVIERLGGTVEVDSDLGKGTAVRLYLPAWK
ncbi:MAG TPA: ATP-binding protein [Methyloversatilis sp.]